MTQPVAFINVEQRKLEWARPMNWHTPTVANLPKIPLYQRGEHMKEIVIKREGKEPITIIVTESELRLAAKYKLTEREYIEQKVKLTLDEELKDKNT